MTDQGPDLSADDDADLTAAEQVLGLLEGDERTRAYERADADPAFRARVDAWERRLSPLTGDVAPVEPPAAVWDRIAASITAPTNVLAFRPRGRLSESLGLWRAATAVSLLAAAACLALVLLPPKAANPPVAAHDMVATLTSPDGKALYVATFNPTQNHVTVVPVSAVEAPGRSPELWIIPAGGKPRAVGLIERSRPITVPASTSVSAEVAANAILAVSLEPVGGSPTGAPTGPVIATGALRSI